MQSYGGIQVSEGVAAQAFTGTPSKLTAFNEGGPSGSFDEGDRSIEPDAANDKIKLRAGTYLIFFNGNGSSASAAAGTFQFHARLDGAELSLGAELIVTATDQGVNIGFVGVVDVPPGDDGDDPADLEVYGERTSGSGPSLTFTFAQLTALKVG